MSFILSFLCAFLIVLGLIPCIINLARKRGWFDSIGERKIHTGQIPRLGGVGIICGFFVALVLSFLFVGLRAPNAIHFEWRFVAILGAGLGYHLLGLIDDFKNLRARLKLLFQIIFSALIVFAGYYFRVIEIPVAPYSLDLGFLGPVITFFWILGITNALNLIDGLDGLASGIALIGACVWAGVYLKTGQILPALIALSAGGAILGFLFYNFPPATIFMGDSGSLFLGYILAVLPLLGGSGDKAETGLIPAITICLIPILDTFAAIF